MKRRTVTVGDTTMVDSGRGPLRISTTMETLVRCALQQPATEPAANYRVVATFHDGQRYAEFASFCKLAAEMALGSWIGQTRWPHQRFYRMRIELVELKEDANV